MKNLRNILLLLFLISDGCVDQLDVPVLIDQHNLVVDGSITDQPGPYKVKLFLSSSLSQSVDRPVYVSGASVQIKDDLGNTEQLTETTDGTYLTAQGGMQGVVGRKYQVLITTTEGKHYQSELAELTPAGEIESIDFKFQENVINQNDIGQPQDAFAVTVNARGTTGFPSLFRWRWTGIYHIRTFPELNVKYVDDFPVPDPLPCSGYQVTPGGAVIQVDTCNCCDCWRNQYSNSVMISNNDYIEGNEFKSVPIAQITVDKNIFYEKYYIGVEQMSIPEDVYQFWRLVDTQEEGSGNIFQPNIVKIKGNIHCTSNPDEEVFGIFSVSAITKKSIFITRFDIPKRIAPIDTATVDCRAYAGAYNKKPPFW